MKTIVFALKPGYEEKTNLGYKRVELIPGHCTPFLFGEKTDNPTMGTLSYCFEDGNLSIFTGDVNAEASECLDDTQCPYLMTYEEALWL